MAAVVAKPEAGIQPRVYLAGPAVFDRDPNATFSVMKRICAQHGLVGLSPLDNQIGLEGASADADLMHRIVDADISLMRSAEAGIMCLDGFRRGPEMDPGTAFEVGFMHALEKPLVGWSSDIRTYPERVRAYFADTFDLTLAADTASGNGGRSGTLRDPDGVLVHSETCIQNAMVHVGIQRGGGIVATAPDWEVAFGEAVGHLAGLLAQR